MKKPLVKISDDVLEQNIPYAGRYRDEKGTPLHGIFVRQHKYTEEKLFIMNGNSMRRYRYPRIDRSFTSPLVNDYNLHLVGGWSWPGVRPKECVLRVFDGLKPMGFWIAEEEEYEEWRTGNGDKRLNDFPSRLYFEDSFEERDTDEINIVNWVCVSVPGTFDEHFDLVALANDYKAYAKGAKVLDEYIDDIEHLFLDKLKGKPVADYLTSDYANPYTFEELALKGLMLGYPIESTVSILWME